MIVGIGTDIIEIKRIERACSGKLFMKRVFTENEYDYISHHNIESAAGYYAAKEAVVKALGTGFSGIGFKDVEIVKIKDVPSVLLHGNARDIADKKNIANIILTISHCREYATAVAIMEA